MVRVLAVADEVCDALWGAQGRRARPGPRARRGRPAVGLPRVPRFGDRPAGRVRPGQPRPRRQLRPRSTGPGSSSAPGCRVSRPARPAAATPTASSSTPPGCGSPASAGASATRPGPNQYSQREYHRRAARLLRRVGACSGGSRAGRRPADPRTAARSRRRGRPPHVGIDALHPCWSGCTALAPARPHPPVRPSAARPAGRRHDDPQRDPVPHVRDPGRSRSSAPGDR